jgi:two-component system KDP operon response regulator KdpE
VGERILVIEDDDSLSQLMRIQLENGGYDVTVCNNGLAGLTVARQVKPDLILLDILLPKLNGWQVCQGLQQITKVPIIFITALGADADLLRGLEMGADDYIIKPFDHKELWARVRAALYRARRTAAQKRQYQFGRLSVDLDARTVKVDDERIFLTPMEYNLLAVLVEEGGRVVSHAALLRRVWGPQFEDRRQYLKLYIWYLRQKIEQDPAAPAIILTERGIGYRLAPPLSAATP